MMASANSAGAPPTSGITMATWQRWLFNWLSRWEEASIARSLGVPADRLFLVDVSTTESDRAR